MHRTPHALQTPVTAGIKTVTSIAVRCPTVTAAGESLPSGHCYLMLPPTITLRDLITEKVRAEFRKLRAAGKQQSSIALLLPANYGVVGDGPLDENLALKWVMLRVEEGDITVAVNGHEIEDLGTTILLNRETSVAFIVAAPVLA